MRSIPVPGTGYRFFLFIFCTAIAVKPRLLVAGCWQKYLLKKSFLNHKETITFLRKQIIKEEEEISYLWAHHPNCGKESSTRHVHFLLPDHLAVPREEYLHLKVREESCYYVTYGLTSFIRSPATCQFKILKISVAEPEPVEAKLFKTWSRSRNYCFTNIYCSQFGRC